MDSNSQLSASELATINFYKWEYQFRGYYHFDTPIDIELPYVSFQHLTCINTHHVDDGKVSSLLKHVSKFLSSPKDKDVPELEVVEVEPRFLEFENKPNLVGMSLSFLNETEILPSRNLEFLNMLSFSEHSISFEIIGRSDDITIQIVCSVQDKPRVRSHFQAYFPNSIVQDVEITDFGFSRSHDIAIADFGLNNEYMRSITTVDSFAIDPLTPIIATMESIQHNELAVFQMLIRGIRSPLAKDISNSVSDGKGGSFFVDAPEMPSCAKVKIAHPLFSVVMRIATQGESNLKSQYLAQELARSISAISHSEFNKLIPLSNEGYNYNYHSYNLEHRLSNRLGFILNSKELNTFFHYPNKSIVSKKLRLNTEKTKQVPNVAVKQKYLLGVNHHNSVETNVMLSDEMRLRHVHIIGATGVGKSTLLANMLIEDMRLGNGVALLDPHGDIVEDVLLRVPEHRKNDVIVIDPYDTEFPIGFNIISANTDAEKIVLSSDIVSVFKRFATSWGDNMSSVLSQAVNTFLESSTGGTLIELKRFLLEEKFRKNFLKNVQDPSIHYYWNNEYSYLKNRIAPLLTRIDTFLRPKIVRYMLAQKGGIDFKKCIDEKKIVLIKLSQGLIGEENSYLLGSLFLSKFNQVAQSRQSLAKEDRHPYYIFCDEFQNFITPSISQILSGARKYGLGLTLAHQEIAQIDDYKTLNSVISNPYIRICFKLGDIDSKKLESGFSYFDESDLQSSGIGQAIMRIGSSKNDCNLSTFPFPDVQEDTAHMIKEVIIKNTREKYAQSRLEVEAILASLLPKVQKSKDDNKSKENKKPESENKKDKNTVAEVKQIVVPNEDKPQSQVQGQTNSDTQTVSSEIEKQKNKYEESLAKRENIRKHRVIQDAVHEMAIQRGFKSVIEEATNNGGRVDVGLTKNKIRIAIEISVTNTTAYETQNLIKCIDSGYSHLVLVSESEVHLKNIKKNVQQEVSKEDYQRIHFCKPQGLVIFLDSFKDAIEENTKRHLGYRVTATFRDENGVNKLNKQQELTNLILSSLHSKKGKKQ
nr:DUF87 domain-containing protein [uncultured Psychroserpens sp.]